MLLEVLLAPALGVPLVVVLVEKMSLGARAAPAAPQSREGLRDPLRSHARDLGRTDFHGRRP